MTRIDAILAGIRRELLKRPQALEGGMSALMLTCYFEGDTWTPRRVVMRPEFNNPRPRSRRSRIDYRAAHKLDGA